MGLAESGEDMVKYQFQADDDEWQDWKNTVPRSKSLETRINELIRADTEGGVHDDLDLEGVRDALDDVEAAAERGDGAALQDALRRARDAIEEG